MWTRISGFILRNRLALLLVTIAITGVMGYFATKIRLTYEINQVIPLDDPEFQKYLSFKSSFGEDGNTFLVGVKTEKIFEKDFINASYTMCKQLEAMDGVDKVLSFTSLQALVRNEEKQQFQLAPIMTAPLTSQEQADSLWDVVKQQKFYEKLLFNAESHVAVFALTINKVKINSKARETFIDSIVATVGQLESKFNIDAKFSGLPYTRTILARKVGFETQLFTLLSFVMCAIVMVIFFRSLISTVYSMIIVAIGLIWSLGFIGIMGYKINAVLGIIPPLIVIIGITNCIFLLYKYHFDYRAHGNKVRALVGVVARIGKAAFLTNITTAVGFGVFYFTSSPILKEFGISAFVSIFATFIISMITVPVLFSYVKPPTQKQTKYLDNKSMGKITNKVFEWVTNYRKPIYVFSVLIVIVSVIGTYKVKTLSFIIDDVPEGDQLIVDLKFFEKELGGIMPYEIVVESKNKGGMKTLGSFQKIEQAQKELAKIPELSKALSIGELLKYANMAYNQEEELYRIPNSTQIQDILSFIPNTNASNSLLKNLVDSTFTRARISVQMEDMGTEKLTVMNDTILRKLNAIFPAEDYKIDVTGTSVLMMKNNEFLIKSLYGSNAWAIGIISLMLVSMFGTFQMIVIAMIPNIIPLIMTSGVMGIFGIPLKPTTVVVFSIAFGISVDFTIHFVAIYRHELKIHKLNMSKAVRATINETGASMIYTAAILFFGFIIFALSTFGGTFWLGVLTSFTLLVSLFTNLFLLPAMVLSMEKRILKKVVDAKPIIDIEDDPDEHETEENDKKES